MATGGGRAKNLRLDTNTGSHQFPSGNGPSSDYCIISPPGSHVSPGSLNFHMNLRLSPLQMKSWEDSAQWIHDLLRQNHDLRENVDLTNRAMKEVSLQMENLQNVSDKEKKMTRSWCEDAKEAISKLKLTLQDRDAIIGDLKQELQELKAQGVGIKGDAGAEIDKRDRMIRELRNCIEEMNLSHKHNKMQIDHLAKYKESLKSELQQVKSALAECQKNLSSFEANQEILEQNRIKAEEVNQLLREHVGKLEMEKQNLLESLRLKSGDIKDSSTPGFVMVPGNTDIKEPSLEPSPDLRLDTGTAPGGEKYSRAEQEERGVLKEELKKLQERNAALLAKLEEKETKMLERAEAMTRLERQVDEERERMECQHAQRVKELMTEIHNLQQLNQKKDQNYGNQEELANLRSQVTSLMNEAIVTERKKEMTNQACSKMQQRISDQEQRIESLQAEMKQIREEDDQSIQTLRSTLKYFEDKVESLKADLEARRRSYAILLEQHNLMQSEYQQGHKAAQNGSSRHLEEQVDALTAQLMAASEVMETKKRLIQDLMRQKDRLTAQVETIPIHEAQLELYKQDFEAERKAREENEAEKDRLKSELRQLQEKNQQLNDQLSYAMRNQFPPSSAYSEAPVGSFSHHHNVQPPPLPQQYSYHQPGGHTHGSSNRRGRNFQMPPGYDMCDSAPTEPLSYHGVNDRKVLQTTEVALQNLRQDVDTQRMAQESGSHNGELVARGVTPPALECPKCKRPASDMASLENHFADCLDLEN